MSTCKAMARRWLPIFSGTASRVRFRSNALQMTTRSSGVVGTRRRGDSRSVPLPLNIRRVGTARCLDGSSWCVRRTTTRLARPSSWTPSRSSVMLQVRTVGTAKGPLSSTLRHDRFASRWSGPRTASWPRRHWTRLRSCSRDEWSLSWGSPGASPTRARLSPSMMWRFSRNERGTLMSNFCGRRIHCGSSRRARPSNRGSQATSASFRPEGPGPLSGEMNDPARRPRSCVYPPPASPMSLPRSRISRTLRAPRKSRRSRTRRGEWAARRPDT